MPDGFAIPVLETKRLRLCGHGPDDLAGSIAMWGDAAVVAHISGTASTPLQTRQRLRRYARFWRELKFGYWAVQTKRDHRFIGEVGFADWQRHTRPDIRGVPEAGWVLCSDAHGQGYATEAVAAMVHWADLNLPHHRTVCIMDPHFAPSRRVAEKVGYGRPVLGRFNDLPTLFMERPRQMAV